MNDAELTERITKAPDIESLYRECRAVAEHLGFSYFLFGTRLPVPLDKPCQLILSGYPASWRSRYDEQRYMLIDPILAHAVNSVLPVEWSSIETKSPAVNQFFCEAREAGLVHGLTVPVHGIRGERSLISLAGSDRRPESQVERQDLLRRAQWFATNLHETLRKLSQASPTKEPMRGELRNASLTARERDCLRRAARGESSSEIGTALNISERTVIFHLDRCQKKLGVRGRQHAIARAVILGEIEPDCYPNRIINSSHLLEARGVLYTPLER